MRLLPGGKVKYDHVISRLPAPALFYFLHPSLCAWICSVRGRRGRFQTMVATVRKAPSTEAMAPRAAPRRKRRVHVPPTSDGAGARYKSRSGARGPVKSLYYAELVKTTDTFEVYRTRHSDASKMVWTGFCKNKSNPVQKGLMEKGLNSVNEGAAVMFCVVKCGFMDGPMVAGANTVSLLLYKGNQKIGHYSFEGRTRADVERASEVVQQAFEARVPEVEARVPDLEMLIMTKDVQVRCVVDHLQRMKEAWEAARVPLDKHPISHVIVEGLQDWNERRSFKFDKKIVDRLVCAVRMDFDKIYSICVLAVYQGGRAKTTEQAYLLALYTDPEYRGVRHGELGGHEDDHKTKFAYHALESITRYLFRHNINASLPSQACVQKVMSSESYRKIYTDLQWSVANMSGSAIREGDQIIVTYTPV